MAAQTFAPTYAAAPAVTYAAPAYAAAPVEILAAPLVETFETVAPTLVEAAVEPTLVAAPAYATYAAPAVTYGAPVMNYGTSTFAAAPAYGTATFAAAPAVTPNYLPSTASMLVSSGYTGFALEQAAAGAPAAAQPLLVSSWGTLAAPVEVEAPAVKEEAVKKVV